MVGEGVQDGRGSRESMSVNQVSQGLTSPSGRVSPLTDSPHRSRLLCPAHDFLCYPPSLSPLRTFGPSLSCHKEVGK